MTVKNTRVEEDLIRQSEINVDHGNDNIIGGYSSND